jgi:hypothetical protein
LRLHPPRIAEGFGGAIFCSLSQVLVHEFAFGGCIANFGGAILNSGMRTIDSRKSAYARGRSRRALCEHRDDRRESLRSKRLHFHELHIARNGPGAVYRGLLDAAIDGSTFSACAASRFGRAVLALDSNLLVFKTNFFNNLCGVNSLDICPETDRFPEASEHLRGGALDVLAANSQKKNGRNAMGGFQIATEDTCFVGNLVYRSRMWKLMDVSRKYRAPKIM